MLCVLTAHLNRGELLIVVLSLLACAAIAAVSRSAKYFCPSLPCQSPRHSNVFSKSWKEQRLNCKVSLLPMGQFDKREVGAGHSLAAVSAEAEVLLLSSRL